VRLLTAAEEVELAEQIARGAAAKQRLELGESLPPWRRMSRWARRHDSTSGRLICGWS